MSRVVIRFAFLVAIGASAPLANALPPQGSVRIEPFNLQTFDGQQHAAELGKLTVPENRSSKSTRTIEVAFIRLLHRGEQAGAPTIFLPPGPGIPATILGRVPPYFRLLDRLRDHGDVILLDIRGEGMSSPNLDECPGTASVSGHVFESFATYVQQFAASVGNCAQFWRSKGVDLSAYNNREIAGDIEALRQALNYERIRLLGFSAGTDLGVAVLTQHGDTVERAVFAATGAPELRPNLPSTYDRQLEKVALWHKEGGSDAPDLVALFDHDAQALDAHPAVLTLTAGKEKRPVQVKVRSVALKAVVADMLNGSVSLLPALLTSVRDGDNSLLQIFVQKAFTGFHGSMTLIGRTIDCSAAMPADRLARVEAEARASRFGDVRNVHLQPAVCRAALGKTTITDTVRQPLFSRVPTLFISGAMDANTPPFYAETLRWAFPNGVHVVVNNGFHETLPAPEVQDLVVDFFAGRTVAGRTITFDRPRFLSLEEARTAAQRSR